jgi:hypothetical protein
MLSRAWQFNSSSTSFVACTVRGSGSVVGLQDEKSALRLSYATAVRAVQPTHECRRRFVDSNTMPKRRPSAKGSRESNEECMVFYSTMWGVRFTKAARAAQPAKGAESTVGRPSSSAHPAFEAAHEVLTSRLHEIKAPKGCEDALVA